MGPQSIRRSLPLIAAIVAVTALLVAPAGASDVAHPSIVSEDPAGFTPDIMDGRVNAIIVMNGTVFVGGTFTTVRNAGSSSDLTRDYLFAFDATTGAVNTSFRPDLSGKVEALAPGPDGASVYVGGSFGQANGSGAYGRLVRVDATTGATIASFKADPNDQVLDLVRRGSDLYAAGEFTQIGRAARSGLARLDVNTGTADPALDLPFTRPWVSWVKSPMRVWRIDVTPDGSKLLAAGNFRRVGGELREQVAILDVGQSPVTLDDWSTTFFRLTVPHGRESWCLSLFPHYVRDVDISPDGTYAAVVTTGANFPDHPSCDSVSRWDLTVSEPGRHPDWVARSGGDSSHSVLVTGAAVYVGGHQQWMNNPYNPTTCGVCRGPYPGGVVRTGFSAHDPANGLPFRWNPVRYPRGKGVLAMAATAKGFFFGSDTDRIHGETHRKLAFMPLAGGVTVPPTLEYGLPAGLFTVSPSGAAHDLLARTFDGTTAGPPSEVGTGVDWRRARGGFVLNGQLYVGKGNGTLVRGSFDGVAVGPRTLVGLHRLDHRVAPIFQIPGTHQPIPRLSSQLADATGMFFEHGFLYYTVRGDPRLYARGFTQESEIVGAPLLVASTGDRVDWAKVRGMTMADGTLFFALADGTLKKVAWSGDPFGHGHPTGRVTTIGGPDVDATDWSSNGMFVFGG
jgi:hypothetical protein